ncbi:MAG: hypothetical protein IIX22_07260, partial [Ruminococcus sp.]|nr:hypothetical protein [Ruminococcus sp.]
VFAKQVARGIQGAVECKRVGVAVIGLEGGGTSATLGQSSSGGGQPGGPGGNQPGGPGGRW